MSNAPGSCLLSTTLTHSGLFAATLFRQNRDGTWNARRRLDLPDERRKWLDGPWRDVRHWRSCTREMVENFASLNGGEWYPGPVEAMKALPAKREKAWELAYMTAWGGGNRHE